MSQKPDKSRAARGRPAVIRTLAALRRALAPIRARRESIALVPTMGALHAGHLALVRLARRKAQRVVVSIFVNPTQFAPHEDFASYPRTWAADLTALAELKVDIVWAPSAAVMYPPGFDTRIVPGGPAQAGLEDKFRPHFFSGVATVVAKLFLQVAPDVAVFGEKDFQQLKVVSAMARDLNIPVKIVGAPIVRDKDGLALSSRNAYLSATERQLAPTLHRVLRDCARRLKTGEDIHRVLGEGRAELERAGFAVDYLEVREADTLAPVTLRGAAPLRLLVAARLGRTRLIDNVAA